MSQEELALKTGYKSRSSINKIEKGLTDINQAKVVKFSTALNVSVAYLMGWEDRQVDGIIKNEDRLNKNHITSLESDVGIATNEDFSEFTSTRRDIMLMVAQALEDLNDNQVMKVIEYARFIKYQENS